MSWKELAADPVGWVTSHLKGAAEVPQIDRYVKMMDRTFTGGVEKLGQEMIKRDETPRIIRMPDWALMHFEGNRGYKPITYSTLDRLNPTIVDIADGNKVWEYRGRGNRWSALTAGIDIDDSGELCHSGGCAPRAVAGAMGGVHDYDSIVADMQEAFFDPTQSPSDDIDARFITFEGNDGPNDLQLEDYLDARYVVHNGLGMREFGKHQIPDYARFGGNERKMRGFLNLIAKDHPRSVVFLKTKQGEGHAISYFNGLQQRHHPLDGYWGWNTQRVSNLFTPLDKNRTLDDMMADREY